LEELRAAGTLFDVELHRRWVGVVAAEPGVQHGLRGAIVVELLLDPAARGKGYGKHLSTLLAQQLEAPDDWFLLGTIHLDNTAAYRSALAAGRRDVGGDVLLPLPPD
jgi:L-amino acid N-acyltransferase YncA